MGAISGSCSVLRCFRFDVAGREVCLECGAVEIPFSSVPSSADGGGCHLADALDLTGREPADRVRIGYRQGGGLLVGDGQRVSEFRGTSRQRREHVGIRRVLFQYTQVCAPPCDQL